MEAAESTKREISGFFLSSEKFAQHVAALESPACRITQLRLFHNEPHHTQTVVRALGTNASLTSLDIFELDPAAATSLAAVLPAMPRLTSLAVQHPHGFEAVGRLCPGLAANSTLSHLHFSHLDSRCVGTVAAAVASWRPRAAGGSLEPAAEAEQLPRLEHLRLEKCSISAEVAAGLAAALGSQGGALARLEVVGCDMGGAAAAALLAGPCLASLKVLVTLDLSSCNMGAQGAAQLAQLLAFSETLETLNASRNRSLGCAGAALLQPGLARSRSLRHLDLSGCGIGPEGACALAAAIHAPPDAAAGTAAPDAAAASEASQLRHLVLSDNAVGSTGLLALLRAMAGPSPCALRTLQLERNHIRGLELAAELGVTVQGAAASAAAALLSADVPVVTAPLEQLSLESNSLYDAGVAALVCCLSGAPCLQQLDLRSNGVSDAGVAALLPLLAPVAGGRAGLQGLLLDGNRLHNSGGQLLLEAVTAAPALWRFSAEANKLTDPALRLSLTQLSQLRAARHSQLVVLGRQYSSSSSDSRGSSRRGSGGGGGSGGGAPGPDGGGGGAQGRGAEQPPSMDTDPAAGGGGQAGGAGAPGHGRSGQQQGQQQGQQPQQHQKHRMENQTSRGAGSGDEREAPRNVAARGLAGAADVHGAAGQGWGGAAQDRVQCVGGGSSPISVPAGAPGGYWQAAELEPCMPYGGVAGDGAAGRVSCSGQSSGYGGCRDSIGGGDSACDAASFGGASSGRGGSARAYGSVCSSGGGAAPMSCSPPPAECFVAALTGAGGAAPVGVSKRVSTVRESDHPAPGRAAPQQLLPPTCKPRYKPLTPEQQRMFVDF
ncbi:Protein NLRC3 [Tetrabaena socialis]|uniref:Protein NLRC3 n=1 Tax=Tetrabaena socialis TaxID=47790 RepID=A0A2J8AAP2_9CHLO|nr:Protein NLRC3 [Tetrabaena socialis]|eukprot:PNH09585.1 Protein NLRC3 [Tetrabaena socialis]